MHRFDVLIIGSGQGGTALARTLAKQGKKVALFERDRLGGSCVNYGCTPSKALLAAAHLAGWARKGAALGVEIVVKPDFTRVMQRVREIRQEWRGSVNRLRDQENLTVIAAEAAFTARRTISAGGESYTAERIVINTGTSPAVPPIDGLKGTPYLTNKNIFDLKELPTTTAVIGGGYIGLELGQALLRLGSRVHLIESDDRLLPGEPAQVGDLLRTALEQEGMRLRLGTSVDAVRHVEGRFMLNIGDETLDAEALLVAVGRTPNTQSLNAPAAEVELDPKGYVRINDRFETAAEGVYAIGDCAGQPAFTHVSYEDHRRLLSIWSDRPRDRCDRTLAYAVFTDPQVGCVGLSLGQAQEAGFDPVERTTDLSKVARGREWNHEHGFMQLIADSATERLLGGVFVGWEAAELVQILIPLIDRQATWRELADSVFIHPTYGEALMTLAREFE